MTYIAEHAVILNVSFAFRGMALLKRDYVDVRIYTIVDCS